MYGAISGSVHFLVAFDNPHKSTEIEMLCHFSAHKNTIPKDFILTGMKLNLARESGNDNK
jgi:hypothetical protein